MGIAILRGSSTEMTVWNSFDVPGDSIDCLLHQPQQQQQQQHDGIYLYYMIMQRLKYDDSITIAVTIVHFNLYDTDDNDDINTS